MAGLLGRPATELADLVRRAEATPLEVVREHLDHIGLLDPRLGAFRVVRAARALAEAEEVAGREDLASLPLAGVPVAVKDHLPVAGEAVRFGSLATPELPSAEDHPSVRRLRESGAVIVGITRMPEFGAWATTDGPFGISRNPWDPTRTPGGSSGGAGAAVASAMAPLALASDGFGSIRIPAGVCGLVGVKPGSGVAPVDPEINPFGMGEIGPLATTVADAALLLSLVADRPDLRDPSPPGRKLRIAVATGAPLPGRRVDRSVRAAALETASLLSGAGHDVQEIGLRFPTWVVLAVLSRWFAGGAHAAEAVDPSRLEKRTRRHAAAGRVASRLRAPREADRARFHAWSARKVFGRFDVLLTPAVATRPPLAAPWHRRGWTANVLGGIGFAPFAAAWNLAGYPAAVVPAGLHPAGTPLAVQLIASGGEERLLLDLAAQLEALRPWPRHAPLAGIEPASAVD